MPLFTRWMDFVGSKQCFDPTSPLRAEKCYTQIHKRIAMTKRLIPLLILLCLLGSCAPAPAASTSTPTATPYPSRTPHPTQTPIPTATPYPPLQTEGPYLLFTYDNKNFTIMDADGSGRRQFQLPNDGHVGWNFNKFVSPDEKWLAYFTGSIDEPNHMICHLIYSALRM